MNQNVNPKNKSKIHFELAPDLGTLSYDSTKKYFTIFGLAIFAFSAATLAAQTVLVYLISFLVPNIAEMPRALTAANYILSFVPLYLVGLPVLMAILKKLPSVRLLKQKMTLSHAFGGFCIGILFMLTGNLVSNYLMILLQSLKGGAISNPVESATVGNPWWLNLIFVGILAPILEEILFRKIICSRLLPLGEGWAIFLSAAVFGLAHGNFYQFFYAFALGALFAFIYVKTGKLIYSTVYHMAINIIGGVIAPLLSELISRPEFSALLDPQAQVVDLSPENMAALLGTMSAYLIYLAGLYGMAIAGIVLLIKAINKKKLSLDAGLLPPVKEGKFSALFMNVGVALSIAYFTLSFTTSILS